jgi:hypothetical protein
MSFTVKIEPRKIASADPEAPDDPKMDTYRTVYDIHVYDGDGEDLEEKLVFSNQGYENRQFAVSLAVRLFGAPGVIASHNGVSLMEHRTPENALLVVLDADGEVVTAKSLR